MPLDIYGTERPRRAEVLTSPATYAPFRVDYGDLDRVGVIGIRRDHEDGPRRAMTGAIAARDAVGERNAIVLNPDGMAYAGGRLVLLRDGADGPCGAHLGAASALGTAIASLVRHLGLHEPDQVGRRAQHIVGAS